MPRKKTTKKKKTVRKKAGRKKKAVKKTKNGRTKAGRKKAGRKKAVRKKKTVRRKKAGRKKAVKKKTVRKKKAGRKKKAVKKKGRKKRKPNPAFMRSFKASPVLQAIVGSATISRPHATKKIWDYIKKHDLQDARKRRQINVGGTKLGKMFPGKRHITMFELPKGLGRHLKD